MEPGEKCKYCGDPATTEIQGTDGIVGVKIPVCNPCYQRLIAKGIVVKKEK